MTFDFGTAGRILFGSGVSREVVPAASRLGTEVLLVSGGSPRIGLDAAVALPVTSEPSLDLVRHGVAMAREAGCDVVVAVGGGSAIDAGKAIAALLANPGDPLDYLEVVGKGKPLTKPSVPFIAVPTTAGTGAEVTRNAVLASTAHRVKASLRSPFLLPRMAVVDPDLTLDLPPEITAATGLDALTQLIEPYVSTRANAMADLFCLDGMRRAALALPKVFHDGNDRAARSDMSFASLMGGLALANAGLGAVHGFAAPIGGAFDAPHGAVCAALLPHAMEINIRALRGRDADGEGLRRYAMAARVLTGFAAASPEDGAAWVARLCEQLQIPPLSSYGITAEHAGAIVDQAQQASSMKANPIALEREELLELLERAL